MLAKPAIVTLSSERKTPTVTPDGASAEPEAPRPPAENDDALSSSVLWTAESAATGAPLPALSDVLQARRRCASACDTARRAVSVAHAHDGSLAVAAGSIGGAWRCAWSAAC